MRRIVASHLLAIFTIPLLLPLASEKAESKLPACCRRDGQHHCVAMGTAVDTEPNGAAVKANPTQCPLFPKASTAPESRLTMLAAALPALHFALQSFAAPVRTSDQVYFVFRGFSVLRRGPPSHFC